MVNFLLAFAAAFGAIYVVMAACLFLYCTEELRFCQTKLRWSATWNDATIYLQRCFEIERDRKRVLLWPLDYWRDRQADKQAEIEWKQYREALLKDHRDD